MRGHKLSVEAASVLSGVPVTTLRRIVRGELPKRFETAQRLRKLGVSLDDWPEITG